MEKESAGERGFTRNMESFIHPEPDERRAKYRPRNEDGQTEINTFCHLCPAHCAMNAIVDSRRLRRIDSLCAAQSARLMRRAFA